MEQMVIILRFVDKDGFIRERLFYIVNVKDTTASTLKKKICDVLSCRPQN
jgi:DNA-binding Xre family transcriptional regulator